MNLARETKLSPGYRQRLEQEITYLERQSGNESIAPDLKRSLEGKLLIVRKRLENLSQGEQKLRYVDAELSRIEQQVELLREQAVLSRDSQSMASEIDLVQSSLGDTADWIKEQRSLFGELESLTEEAPPLLGPLGGAREQG